MRVTVTAARMTMRLRRARLVGLLVAAGALVGVLVASSASAVTAPRTVPLHVTVNGSGTLRVPGNPAFTCHASFPASSHCRHTFYFRKGRRIVLKASPCERLEAVEVDRGLSRIGDELLATTEGPAVRVRHGVVVPPGDRLNPYALGTPVTFYHPATQAGESRSTPRPSTPTPRSRRSKGTFCRQGAISTPSSTSA